MSRAYKFHKPDGLYFITFATVAWVDVFTRRDYKDIVVESPAFSLGWLAREPVRAE